jgi:hypothetical protein
MGYQAYLPEVLKTIEEIGFVVQEVIDVREHESGVTNFIVFCKVSI